MTIAPTHRYGFTNASRSDVADWRVAKSPPRVSSTIVSTACPFYDAIGMILYSVTSQGIKYALVKRRSGYGLQKVLNAGNICDKTCFTELSIAERSALLDICDRQGNFEETYRRLWQDAFWGEEAVCERMIQRSFERFMSKRSSIREGIMNTTSIFPDGVWGFPKGKNDKHQNEVMCAFREVREETGLSSASVTVQPFDAMIEKFKQWKYKYFIAQVNSSNAINRSIPKVHKGESEVSEVVWLSFEEAHRLIPAVMEEKKILLSSLHSKLTMSHRRVV
jgi:8-oxo-dGTP pyrophosphatase MutT (NUDIX family)